MLHGRYRELSHLLEYMLALLLVPTIPVLVQVLLRLLLLRQASPD